MAQAAFDPLNPCQLDGVSFIEFSGQDPAHFDKLFVQYGFKKVSQIPGRQIFLYRQGLINFIVNCQPGTFSYRFAELHGPCISATGFRTLNSVDAFRVATSRGAVGYLESDLDRGASVFPAIYGIGGSLIYFVDAQNEKELFSKTFEISAADQKPVGMGLNIVDHFTNNVPVGEMQKWCDFYTKIFNFRETRYFDIRGQKTGLISKVMRSPCNKFAVPINEPTDSKSQIQEYLNEYKGSGIQHLALTTEAIAKVVDGFKGKGLEFLSSPPVTYYRDLKDRVPNVKEQIDELQKLGILVDGDHEGYLLQIFSKNIIGPIFFEIIQRRGHEGFGEGNFQALFDAIERDQKERGYL